MDAVDQVCRFALGTSELPPVARRATKVFLLDSLGVGAVGSAAPYLAELVAAQAAWGRSEEARLFVLGTSVPAPTAALVNSYMVHSSEFDCVHEGAVVHPMAVLLAAALAAAERQGGVSGQALLTALAVGVEVACSLGVAARAGMRFFRPATAGAFGACAAIGRLRGFDADTLREAMSAAYGQLCGTMQAHSEGSAMLALQAGFNARNAVVACDLAAAGIAGPRQVLEGPYGYFNLFEAAYDWRAVEPRLGKSWRITEVAHKPWPSGRATHGIVDLLLSLRARHGFAAADVAEVAARVPPLVHRLVGRPPAPAMPPNYARLCGAYVAACALRRGTVGIVDFRPPALADPETLALAGRIRIEADDNPDANALTPLAVEVVLQGGRRYGMASRVVYGSPARPMPREAQLAKFRRNLAAAARPVPPDRAEALIALIDDLESVADVRRLVDLLQGA